MSEDILFSIMLLIAIELSGALILTTQMFKKTEKNKKVIMIGSVMLLGGFAVKMILYIWSTEIILV
jgi:hypothetical protein